MDWLSADILSNLLRGLFWTITFTLISSIFSVGIGVLVGTARTFGHKVVRRLSAVYVAIHRNIPALVLIIFWAFAVPNVFSADTRSALFFNNDFVNGIAQLTSISIPYYALAALLALTLNTSAYIAELFRAGIGALSLEQVESARLLGATRRDLFRTILLPQGLRTAFPAIATRLVHNMKNTALAALVAVPEFFNATQGAINHTFRATQILFLSAIVYLILSFLFTRLLNLIEWRLNWKRPFSLAIDY